MNNLMPGQQQGAPDPTQQAPQQAPPSPEELGQARADVKAMTAGLMSLAAKPKGSLSKQDVYNAAADMIGQGAFSTPQAKQGLVAELAQMPDDETAIRQIIGQHLMFLAHAQDRIHATYGPGE